MNNTINKLYEDKTIDSYIRKNPRRNAKCSPYLWGDKYNFQENFSNMNIKNIKNNNIQNVNINKINNYKNNNNKNNKNIIRNNDTNEDSYFYLDSKDKIYDYKVNNERYNRKCNNKMNNNINPNNINDSNFRTNFENDNKMIFRKKQDMTLLNMVDIDSKLLMKKKIVGNKNEIDNLHNNTNNMDYMLLEKEIKNNSLRRLTNETNMNPSLMNMRTKSNLDDDFFTSKVNTNYFIPANRNCSKNNYLGKYF